MRRRCFATSRRSSGSRLSLPQLIEARLLIEPDTAALAAARATDTEMKGLGVALDQRLERRAAGGDPRELDMEFHRLVAAAVRNPVHAVLTHALMELEVRVVVPRLELEPGDDAELDAAHRRILGAVAARQPETARAAMHAHITDLERRLAEAACARLAY
jgi:GntR family transcriptional regulator, transcriptional repressor for pyruvate dehydrogenase complex